MLKLSQSAGHHIVVAIPLLAWKSPSDGKSHFAHFWGNEPLDFVQTFGNQLATNPPLLCCFYLENHDRMLNRILHIFEETNHWILLKLSQSADHHIVVAIPLLAWKSPSDGKSHFAHFWGNEPLNFAQTFPISWPPIRRCNTIVSLKITIARKIAFCTFLRKRTIGFCSNFPNQLATNPPLQYYC